MRIAIAGCGQLARMLALAGWEMGHHFSFIADPVEGTDCVDGLGPIVARDDYTEAAALFEALGRPDVITVEKEHVSVALLEALAKHCLVAPSPEAISICQHRGREKTALQNLGISTAPFQLVEDGPSLITAVKALGYPAFVKSCEQGYDGQNQWLLRDPESLEALAAQMDSLPPLVVEGAVHFDRELSMIVARPRSTRWPRIVTVKGFCLPRKYQRPTSVRRPRRRPTTLHAHCSSSGRMWACYLLSSLMREASFA
jgi:5-(carboxyamino)imidazole ribonucleotide synthase